MRRRIFTAGAMALATVLFAAQAQQARQRRVAIVSAARQVDEMGPGGTDHHVAFHEELRRLGWVEGDTLATQIWSGRGRSDLDAFVGAVFASRPDVVFFSGYLPLLAQIRRDSSGIPVVVFGPDPLQSGLVSSLARPTGSITGISSDASISIVGKRLQLLCETVPSIRRVAFFGARYAWTLSEPVLANAAAAMGVTVEPHLIDAGVREADVRSVLAALAATKPDGFLLGHGNECGTFIGPITEQVAAAGLPAIGFQRDFAEAGMLLSYGANYPSLYRRVAVYVDRILRGAKPGDLPVEQPREFDLVVNKKTADLLGFAIPLSAQIQTAEFLE